MIYLWLKVLHVLAIISWMAGILYLYRLLIYHREHRETLQIHDLLTVMERRLYRFITIPALNVAWLSGLAMVYVNPAIARGGWFHTKFLMVILLTAATVYAKKIHIKLAAQQETVPTSKALRIWNEVPTVLMVVIVILVIIKPF